MFPACRARRLNRDVVEAHPVESNLWAMHRDFARNPRTVLHDVADLLWFSTPGSNAWLNGASWCDLGPDAGERIATVGRTARQVGSRAPWITSPACGPADLDALFEAAGWEPEVEPAMAVAVDASFPAPPRGLVIEQVSDATDVREWTASPSHVPWRSPPPPR